MSYHPGDEISDEQHERNEWARTHATHEHCDACRVCVTVENRSTVWDDRCAECNNDDAEQCVMCCAMTERDKLHVQPSGDNYCPTCAGL
jgi:hypothetical protein